MTQYSLAGLHPHVTLGNEGQERAPSQVSRSGGRSGAWPPAQDTAHLPLGGEQSSWLTLWARSQPGWLMSPGSDVQCGNRSGCYWTALGKTAPLPTCSQVLQAGSGEAALPFWWVGGGEWSEQGTPERRPACPRCQHSMGMGREGRQGAASLRWEKRHQRARELRGLAHARGQRTQCSHRSLPGGGQDSS